MQMPHDDMTADMHVQSHTRAAQWGVKVIL